MRRVNPIYLFVALNIFLILARDLLLPADTWDTWTLALEQFVQQLGLAGFAFVLLCYLLCGFFFVPVLIPLNILGGAVYGSLTGTVLALVGVTASTVTSLVAARHVFKGMHASVESNARVQKLIALADRHAVLSVLLIRFSIILPYLVQNLALAATRISITRVTLLTAVSAIPGAAIYSVLGAGIVRADEAQELLLYVGLPIVIMLCISALIAWLQTRRTRAGE